jgi:hypothetical protein
LACDEGFRDGGVDVVRSVDGGTTWTRVRLTGVLAGAVAVGGPFEAWLSSWSAADGLWHTVDGGATWTEEWNRPAVAGALNGRLP